MTLNTVDIISIDLTFDTSFVQIMFWVVRDIALSSKPLLDIALSNKVLAKATDWVCSVHCFIIYKYTLPMKNSTHPLDMNKEKMFSHLQKRCSFGFLLVSAFYYNIYQ